MSITERITGVGACFTVAALLFSAAFSSAGAAGPAPPISGTLTDGKSFNLKNSLAKGPVLVFFVSTSCPVTDESAAYFQKISKAFKGTSLTFIGVANDAKAGYVAWAKENGCTFAAIPDKEYKVIRAYGIQQSPSAVLVGKDGKIVKSWAGWSKGYLEEMTKLSGKMIGKPSLKIDFKGAPAQVQAG